MIRTFVQSGRLEVLPEDESSTRDEKNHEQPATEEHRRFRSRQFSPVYVETVDNDDSDSEQNDGSTTRSLPDSPRVHTEWVLEENPHYVPPLPPPVTETVVSVPVVVGNNPDDAATTVGSSSDLPNILKGLRNYFANLSLTELRDMSDRLHMDITDYVAERERVAGVTNSIDEGDKDNDRNTGSSEQQRSMVGPNCQNSAYHSNHTEPSVSSSIGNDNANEINHDLLENWPVSELRTLAAYTNVDLSLAMDRKSLAALLRFWTLNRPQLERYVVASEKTVPLTVRELVALARDLKVSLSHCVERGEIVQQIVYRIPPDQAT
jgi:hypothetical protein